MGNQCFATTTNKLYQKQLNQINLQELKSEWSAIQFFKIKRIFQRLAEKNEQQTQQQLKLNFDGFCQMFPEFIRYQESQKKQIYDMFDRQNNGYVNWNDFFNSISMCYYAQQKVIAILMFMIFDQHLEKEIDKQQLTLLIDLNAVYFKNQAGEDYEEELEVEFVAQKLLNGKKSINLNQWLERAFQFFQFNKFRKFFNIFREQKLEKQLIQNFSEWNELYDTQQGKYVSYIISFKWFQAWKIYVQNQYGVSFNIQDKNPTTMKSIKTKKSLRTNHSGKNKTHKTQNYATMQKLKLQQTNQVQNSQIRNSKTRTISEENKNYDLIRSIIGEKPKQIYNHFLEGEYAGTFKSGLVQNRDYVFVSEKVWNYLTQIYNGQLQFRRTGFDQIELYPKIVRIYSGMFKGEIQYSSEVFRQVSSHRSIEDLMLKGLEIQKQYLSQLQIFYRAFGMPAWQPIMSISNTLIDLTPNSIVLIVYLKKNSKQQKQFRQKYLNCSKSIKEANLGDTLIFEDSTSKIEKEIIFFNRTVEGKYIIHFVGQSFTNDLCLSFNQFTKLCKIKVVPQLTTANNLKNHKIVKRRGIQDVKNLSFVTSTIFQFLENKNFKDMLLSLSNETQSIFDVESSNKKYLSIILSCIYQMLRSNTPVDPRNIIILVQIFFPNFSNFDVTLINSFIPQFAQRLKEEALALKINDVIDADYSFKVIEKRRCCKCNLSSEVTLQNQYVLPLFIPEPVQFYFQVMYVPFNLTPNSRSIKRYGFQLPKNATLKDYKNMFAAIAEIKHKNYILLQIQSNTIIKNYNHIKDESVTLEQIHLRQDDNIYAFELCVNFSTFIKNHFSFTEADNQDIQQKDLKIGDMIDCRHPEKGWICGKITEKQIMPYTYQENLKVAHKTKGQQTPIQCNYQVAKNIVAFFPSQSSKNCDYYHVKIIQRVYSQANNTMVSCNLPLVIALTGWMRIKEFQYLVYLQVQKFITQQHGFQDENTSANFIGSTTIQKSIMRETTKLKVKKFKQYLYGKNLPYKLNFINDVGHCLICYKFVKSMIHKGESDEHCQGCCLNVDQPISWQINMNDLILAVDWKSIWYFRKDVVKNHQTHIEVTNKRKRDIQTIESCLAKTLNSKQQFIQILCRCGDGEKFSVVRTLPVLPNNLIISLNRIVEENGFKRKIKRPVYFGDENITIHGEQYKLTGVTVNKGHQNNVSFATYIKQSKDNQRNRWIAYNGERVQVVRKKQIDKKRTLVFFYQKIKQNDKSHVSLSKKQNGSIQQEFENLNLSSDANLSKPELQKHEELDNKQYIESYQDLQIVEEKEQINMQNKQITQFSSLVLKIKDFNEE